MTRKKGNNGCCLFLMRINGEFLSVSKGSNEFSNLEGSKELDKYLHIEHPPSRNT